MKKLLAGLFSATLLALTFYFTGCNSGADTSSAQTAEDSVQQLLARGDYLVHSVVNCMDCHSTLDAERYSLPLVPGTEGKGGMAVHEIDKIPGKLWVPNITPYKLKDWTDEEIARAVTRGINKDGDTLFPMMPYHNLSHIGKADLDAVITYIRALKPIETDWPKREMMVPMSVFGPLPDNDYKDNVIPDTSNYTKYGEYLVTIAHCTECHTPRKPDGAPDFSLYLAGGQHFDNQFFAVTTANLTPDSATGLGEWTEEMFLAKFRANSTPEALAQKPGRKNTLMPWSFFGTMTDHDLKCVYAYLRTIPAVSHKIVKWEE